MNAKQRKRLDKFGRAIAFLEMHHPILQNAPPGFAVQLQILENCIATINACAPDRSSGKPRKTAAQRALLREGLRIGQLQPLRRIARVLGKQVAGMPHLVNVKKSAGTQSLLDAAKGAARDLAPYQEQFINRGVAVDFLNRLQDSIQALETAGTANVEANLARSNARAELKKAFEDGGDALMLTDGIVRHSCNADPEQGAATLTVWNTIVPPRGRVNRSASNVVSGTETDVMSGGVA